MRTTPILAFAFSLLLGLSACSSNDADECGVSTQPAGTTATTASTVTVAYTGTLQDGTVFDQNDCATFSLQRTIPGFRSGIAGMAIGETKRFDVPPEQGYGSSPPPGIPPNATLTFEVTLLDVVI